MGRIALGGDLGVLQEGERHVAVVLARLRVVQDRRHLLEVFGAEEEGGVAVRGLREERERLRRDLQDFAPLKSPGANALLGKQPIFRLVVAERQGILVKKWGSGHRGKRREVAKPICFAPQNKQCRSPRSRRDGERPVDLSPRDPTIANPMNIDQIHQQRLARHLGRTPVIAAAVWVAPNATVVGDVTLGPRSSVFYGAVLRGDIARIIVGEGSNIQDNAVVHLADDLDAVIGAWCTIGHAAIIHACTIGDECLIGMGATVLDGANIGARSLVGANSLVPQRFTCPPGSMVYGSPAKVVRPLTVAEQDGLRPWAEKYVLVAQAHAAITVR